NSLDSLSKNIREYNSGVDPKEWVNLICVLNEGIIYNTWDLQRVIDSRDIISLTQKGKLCVPCAVHHKEDALLNFYLALIGGLGKLNLTPPPLEQYIDLPIHTATGHSYRIDGTLSCKDHGQYEAKVTERWVDKLTLFLEKSPRLYKASEYLPYVANGNPDGLDMPAEIDKYAPATYVFTTDSIDPLPLLKFQKEGERVKQMYMSLEVNGKKVFVPTVFIDKDYPFFEPCALCPKGTRSAA
ncbi:MAG: hypothetical protein ACYC2I_12840, partial [Elusimicrobiales bacterium]